MRGSSWPVLADLHPILAGLSWGHWALLWAKFGVWRVALEAGGEYGDVVENQKNMEKRKKFRQILDLFAWRGVQDLGLRSGRGPNWATRVYPRSKLGST